MPSSATAVRDDTIPGDLRGFLARFSTEAACVELLRRWKYPDGFRCIRCSSSKSWTLPTRRLEECAACGFQTSLTAGTLFHKTRKPLSMSCMRRLTTSSKNSSMLSSTTSVQL